MARVQLKPGETGDEENTQSPEEVEVASDEVTAEAATDEVENTPEDDGWKEVKVPRFGVHDGVDEVTALVPKKLRLHLDGMGSHLEISAGMQTLPRAVAEHWYMKASGVKVAS